MDTLDCAPCPLVEMFTDHQNRLRCNLAVKEAKLVPSIRANNRHKARYPRILVRFRNMLLQISGKLFLKR